MNNENSTGADDGNREEFDSLLGGETILPSSITPRNFINARINEIEALTEAIENPQRTAMVFQQLPKKMRRRVMSHNAKRMPNQLKQAHSKLLDKCSAREVGKRPSRKYRRRPSNLRKEYARRQRNNIWLETHIWHAKRFHMVNKWGYKIADFPNDKSYRACYRASAQHCLCQDVSFLCCIELHGSVGEIISGLAKLSKDSFKRKSDLSGRREGLATFNCITGEPIGQANFLWSMDGGDNNVKQLWLWAHPAFSTQLILQLQEVFKPSSVSVKNLQHQLLRFRLIGPKTLDVLSGAFKPIDESSLCSWTADIDYYKNPLKIDELHIQTEYLKKLLVTCDPGQLPPRSVLPALVTTHLPKLPEPLRQREIDPEEILADPVDNVSSPLWCEELRKAITKANERLKINRKKENVNLVSSVTPLPVDRTPVSLLLIHRPGRQDSLRQGYGCGMDIICPPEWGMRIWLCLVHNGGRAAGLRDFDIVETDVTMKAKFVPDSVASNEHISSNYSNIREKHFKLPPAKRPNYQKLGVPSPFEIPWKKLQEDWDDSKELVRVYVVSNGKMNVGSRIYLPSSSDCENKDCPPVEPQHPDPNQARRREAKQKHKRTLRKLTRLRKMLRLKDVPKDELPSSKDIVEKHRVEMEELWLGECQNIRHVNIRETIGFITEGNYSLLQGKCAGYGYITSAGLESLKSLQGDGSCLVLTRTAVSLHYVFANLKVI